MKKWAWIVLAIVVIGGASAGVLYGVLSHREAGLMEVCWSAGGSAVYAKDCSSKHELKWKKSQLPLPVYIDFDEHANKNYRESVIGAMKMWNQEIGEVFALAEAPDKALVTVRWGAIEVNAAAEGKHSGGWTRHLGGLSGPTRAEVVLTEPSGVHAVMRYAAHEFGHVLGLAHDEAPRSIMYPVQPGQTTEMSFILPSDFDKKLLRGLYR